MSVTAVGRNVDMCVYGDGNNPGNKKLHELLAQLRQSEKGMHFLAARGVPTEHVWRNTTLREHIRERTVQIDDRFQETKPDSFTKQQIRYILQKRQDLRVATLAFNRRWQNRPPDAIVDSEEAADILRHFEVFEACWRAC